MKGEISTSRKPLFIPNFGRNFSSHRCWEYSRSPKILSRLLREEIRREKASKLHGSYLACFKRFWTICCFAVNFRTKGPQWVQHFIWLYLVKPSSQRHLTRSCPSRLEAIMTEWEDFKGCTVFEGQGPRTENDPRVQLILRLTPKGEIASGRVVELGRCFQSEHWLLPWQL